jgi:uncharacterized membrane protein YhhN
MIGYIFLIIFFIVAVIDIYSLEKDNKKLEIITKPLLMPLLVLYYIFQLNFLGLDWLIILALIGGLIGDIFLIREDDDNAFLGGMLAFLLGHIFYIISFLITAGANLGRFPILGLILVGPVILNLLLAFPKFKDHLGDFKIPVMVYMGAILTMHITTILRLAVYDFLNPSFYLVWLGSVFFVLSDSIIATRAFNKEIDFPGRAIIPMITYVLAQYFIIQGVIFSTY